MILTGSCSGASERTETFSLVFVSATVTMVLIKARTQTPEVFSNQCSDDLQEQRPGFYLFEFVHNSSFIWWNDKHPAHVQTNKLNLLLR